MIIGLIPARANSRGIIGKNTRMLGGRPLLAWTASAALAAESFDRIILSTDTESIAKVGRYCGLEILMRPHRLAEDTTPMYRVVQHALDTLEWNMDCKPQIVVLLQPTAPFRNPVRIVECLGMLQRENADCVMTVERIPEHYSPDFAWEMDGNRVTPWGAPPPATRQETVPAYSRDGGVYAFTVDSFRKNKSIYGDDCRGIVVPPEEACNLDTESDWREAERRIGL